MMIDSLLVVFFDGISRSSCYLVGRTDQMVLFRVGKVRETLERVSRECRESVGKICYKTNTCFFLINAFDGLVHLALYPVDKTLGKDVV